jgi:hypothetical protein
MEAPKMEQKCEQEFPMGLLYFAQSQAQLKITNNKHTIVLLYQCCDVPNPCQRSSPPGCRRGYEGISAHRHRHLRLLRLGFDSHDAGQISKKSLRAAVTFSMRPSGRIPSSLWKRELFQARIWSIRMSLLCSRLQVPAGIRTRKGNASSLEILVVRGRTTVLSSPASQNSDGWTAKQERCLPGFVPIRGSKSTI